MATTEHSDLEQQIIKTAQQLFIEKGFVETSMSDIAATVGINRLLYIIISEPKIRCSKPYSVR